MSDLPEFEVTREFEAPREMVWRAWTDPDLLHRWYGPGVETVIHGFDLRPGGAWKNEMKFGENSDLSIMIFKEVVPPKKLVWHHSSADKDWNVVSSMMMPDWPKVLLTTVTFEETGNKTTVKLHQIPIDPTSAEIECFAKMSAGMSGGWGKGFTIIDEILSELSA